MNLCSSISIKCNGTRLFLMEFFYVQPLLFLQFICTIKLSLHVMHIGIFHGYFVKRQVHRKDLTPLWCMYIYESGMCRLLHRYFRIVASQLWHYIKWKTLTIVCQVNIVCTVIISRPGGERGHSTNLLFIFAQPENWGRIALCSRALYVHTLQSTLMLSCYSRCF